MAFALFYNSADMTQIVAAFQRAAATLKGADRTYASSILTAGLSSWTTAPVAPVNKRDGDNDTRLVVITTSTKTAFRDFLLKLCANNTGEVHMCAIAKDMVKTSAEPWP